MPTRQDELRREAVMVVHERTVIVVIAALLAATSWSNAHGQETLALENASVVDVTTGAIRRNVVILISDGRIASVQPAAEANVPALARRVDLGGRYVTPGFIDTHVHWFVWFDGKGADSIEIASRGAGVYLANGITTMIDVAGQRNRDEQILRVRAAVEASGQPAPRIYVSGRVDSLTVNRSGVEDAGELTRRLLALGVDGIKIHRGLSGADLRAVVAEANRADRPVYGHTYEMRSTGYHDYTRVAVEAGVHGVFHVSGIAPVDADREPAPPPNAAGWRRWWLYFTTRWLHVDSAMADSLIGAMVARGTWLQPTLVAEELTSHTDWYRDSPLWKYSPLPPFEAGDKTGFPDFAGRDLELYRQAYGRMKWFVRRFHAAGGVLVAGTDGIPIPGFGLQEEMRLLVSAGIPPAGALRAATLNAAVAFGLADSVGVVQPGRVADLVVLEANPLEDIENTRAVHAVVASGRYLSRSDLDRLLERAARP